MFYSWAPLSELLLAGDALDRDLRDAEENPRVETFCLTTRVLLL